MNHVQPVTASPPNRALGIVAIVALTMLFFVNATNNFIDPDVWHQMALFRESLDRGSLVRQDLYAYTPTVTPVVHHEWGTGAVLFLLTRQVGTPGLLIFKYLLAGGIAVLCVHCAWKRGTPFSVLFPLLPVAILMTCLGLTTVRAQMFTMLMTALLLYFLDLDRQGRRWWIGPWLILYVLWLNLHAGFVVGLIFLGLHTVEQSLRREPVGHLIAVELAMLALIAANPYGLAYYPYLWQALLMDRPLITEWAPIWDAWPVIWFFYLLSLIIVGYAIWRTGLKKSPGMILVLATAFASARHQRHLTLYAVVWACYVPAYIQATPLGNLLTRAVTWKRPITLALCGAVGLVSLVASIQHRPWRAYLPANKGDHPVLLYPVGAVAYLKDAGFHGNLMTPFGAGAFVSWHLYPDVKVSIDGRYEVAYAPGVLEEHVAFYDNKSDPRKMLDKYPTDAVLVRRSCAVANVLPDLDGWKRVYRDDVFEIYARAGLDLPARDRIGQHLCTDPPW